MNKYKLYYAYAKDRCRSFLGWGILTPRSGSRSQMVGSCEIQSSFMVALVENIKKLREENCVFFGKLQIIECGVRSLKHLSATFLGCVLFIYLVMIIMLVLKN